MSVDPYKIFKHLKHQYPGYAYWNDPPELEDWLGITGKSVEFAEKFFDAFDDRLCLAHLNSIPSTKEFPYEGARQGMLTAYWNDALKNLPQDFEDDFNKDRLTKIKEAFRPLVVPNPDSGRVFEPEVYSKVSDKEFDARSLNVKQGKLEAFAVGYQGHTAYIVFYRGYMLICNRGERPCFELEDGSTIDSMPIEAFKIDASKFSSEILKNLIRNRLCKSEEPLTYLYGTLPMLLESTRDATCHQLMQLSSKDQKVGNCTSTSLKEALMGAYALLGIEEDLPGRTDCNGNVKGDSSAKAADTSEFSGQGTSSSDARPVAVKHSTPLGSVGIPPSHLKKSKEFKKKMSAHARAFYFDLYWKKHNDKSAEIYDSALVSECARKACLHLQKMGLSIESYPYLKHFVKPKSSDVEEVSAKSGHLYQTQ